MSESSQTHTIRQKTPDKNTHQLQTPGGRGTERGTTLSLEQLQPPAAALVGTKFPSRNEMETALNGFAATQGYTVVVTRSKKSRRGMQQIYYKCDRGGTNKNSRNPCDGNAGSTDLTATIRFYLVHRTKPKSEYCACHYCVISIRASILFCA